MKKCIVIGLGNFGMNISKTLTDNQCEVLGIDSDKETVQKAKDLISHAVIGDAADRSVMTSLSLKDFDVAVVSIGQEMAASILISLYLKEIGIQRIVVRAISEDHAKILKKLGVSDIVFPEKDMAIRIGKMLSMRNTLDYLPLSDEYAIMEVQPPKSFIDKDLRELQIGARYNCHVLGIKYLEYDSTGGPQREIMTKMAPTATDVIPEKSVMIVLGKQSDIEKMQSVK